MRCNKARQEIIWERHHGAGSVVPFSLQAGNDIFFRFYLTKAEEFDVNNAEAGIKYTLNGAEISYDEYTELCSKIFAAEVNTN